MSTYNYSYRAYISLYGRVLNHGCNFSKLWVQIPGSMAAGPGSSKKWHGILQKKQLGVAGRGGAAWGGHVTWCWGGLPHGSNMFKQGWGWKKIFSLWNSGNFFGCFNIFNALP